MGLDLSKVFQIRYVKLHFTLRFPQDSILPKNKASALRGGMGEMLLRANCVSDRNCEKCDFYKECIVQRTMYSQFEKKPDFVTTGDSVGYVVECENFEEEFPSGSILTFNLILFGKTIVYFNQYLQALFALGQNGLGKDHALFFIEQVTNTRGQAILDGNNVYMKYYQVERLGNYVNYRMEQIAKSKEPQTMIFHTPLTQKFGGEFLQEFDMQAITKSIQRRLYMLGAFEEIDAEELYQTEVDAPQIIRQEVRPVQVQRYSSRQDSRMYLKGIRGIIQLEGLKEELLPLYLAGELIHIGKNTSFGFGRYTLR